MTHRVRGLRNPRQLQKTNAQIGHKRPKWKGNNVALSLSQCSYLNSTLGRRAPNYLKKILLDRLPYSKAYSDMYGKEEWKLGTGTVLTRDTVYVARPNDDGCWETVDIGGTNTETGCNTACDVNRKVIGWGQDRTSFTRYHRDYQTPPVCYDEFRNVEEIHRQLDAIVNGLQKVPDQVVSDFIRLLTMRQSTTLLMAGDAGIEVTVTPTTFTNNCKRINLGSADNLPTSRLTMDYLDNHAEDLLYNGYFDKEFLPQGTFAVTMDIQTRRNLTNQNQQTVPLLSLPDFNKTGKYYEYGLMPDKVGNWVMKYDHEQMRFQHIGGGVLERIWPFENVPANHVGLKPQFSTAYKNARYRAYHVYNRDARSIYVPEMGPVNDKVTFKTNRNMMGEWSWLHPDFFVYTDPNTGTVCSYTNDKQNKGYFLGEFELGMETKFPAIEKWIIAQGGPQGVQNDPVCGTEAAQAYQSLVPYNQGCSSLED